VSNGTFKKMEHRIIQGKVSSMQRQITNIFKICRYLFELLRPGIDCALLPRAAVRARQNRSFVYVLKTVFVSSIETRQPRAAFDRRCSSVLARSP
jgi:hypothetical protein